MSIFRFSYQVADYQADVLPPDHPAPQIWGSCNVGLWKIYQWFAGKRGHGKFYFISKGGGGKEFLTRNFHIS